MQTVFDLTRPRDEVLRGELSEEMFAARLKDVIDGRADPVYGDPDRFFGNTYPTDGLRTLLREALGRLTGQSPKSLFDDEPYPLSFNEAAVVGLARRKSPWSWLVYLLQQTGKPLPLPREDDPAFEALRGENAKQLKERFAGLAREVDEVTAGWQATLGQ